MALNLDEDLFNGLNVVPVFRFYSLNTFIIKIIQGRSVTILTSTHTSPYGLKTFTQNSVFAFL